jgi:hypothetical protein
MLIRKDQGMNLDSNKKFGGLWKTFCLYVRCNKKDVSLF